MEGSASRVLAVTRLRDAISRAAAQATDEREQRELIREAIDASGVDIPRDADGPAIESAIERASRQSWGEALAELREAAATLPSHAATLRTVSQLALRCVDPKAGDRSAEFVACALKESAQAALLERQQASSLAWSATVRLGIIAQGVPLPNGVTAGALLEEARRALVSAAQQDPYNALHPTQLARLEAGAGNAGAAASWAAKALELDRLGRLDPLKMMDDRTRAELERLAKGATKGD